MKDFLNLHMCVFSDVYTGLLMRIYVHVIFPVQVRPNLSLMHQNRSQHHKVKASQRIELKLSK